MSPCLVRLFAALALTFVPEWAAAARVDGAVAVAVAMARPHQLIVAGELGPAQRDAILAPIANLYGFWNNGSPELLKNALSPEIFDRALPPGRPRPPRASWLRCPTWWSPCCSRWVAVDRVVSQVRLTGHFTGKLGDAQGTGQAIDFTAIDILRVRDGKVTDHWHLADNLGIMQQAGLLPK